MTPHEVRAKFLAFFKERGHAVLPSAPLVPENDPTTLFINSGVHPLVPYILQGSHPAGPRLASVQKCFRTDDIDEVGDATHQTFFEMLGNWSIGDYFKQEAIRWAFAFLTDPSWLGLDPHRLYVSVFEGDQDAPQDEDSVKIWRETFGKAGVGAGVGERIFSYPKKENWWGPAGRTGPCGPDTEIFYDTQKPHDPSFGERCHPNCDCGRFVEVWNNVFMEFYQDEEGKLSPLEKKNVDTGMGLERLVRILEGVEDNYETGLFLPLMDRLKELAGDKVVEENVRPTRIVLDHLRAATFLIADGVRPGKVDQGSVLRRIVRRAIRHARALAVKEGFTVAIGESVVDAYCESYPELKRAEAEIKQVLAEEEARFGRALDRGLAHFRRLTSLAEVQKRRKITGEQAFDLYQSYGFPIELTEEVAREQGLTVDRRGFEKAMARHQEISRAGMERKFAGGLADHAAATTKLHTATHLLHAALREILGEDTRQTGSNITQERLRFDFTHPDRLTDDELKRVEERVNQKIKENLPVRWEVMPLTEARARGATGLFAEKYADTVKIYTIGEGNGVYSVEFCGGPHVESTGEIGRIKIMKERSAGSGVRRIYAALDG
jgi:alanyl-tRNA synthetase